MFTYLNAITKRQKTLNDYITFFEEYDSWKQFNTFMIMKWIYFGGFVEQANILNKYLSVLNKTQVFTMLYQIIPKNYNFIKYIKKEKNNNEMVEYIKKFHKVNTNIAKDYFVLMSKDECLELLGKFGLDKRTKNKIIKNLKKV